MRRPIKNRPDIEVLADHARVPLVGRVGVKAWALIDLVDVATASQFSWCMTRSGYAMAKDGRGYIYLHRLVCPGDGVGDHIDGDKMNCRRANLRLCTQRENCRNKRQVKPNTVGLKGVSPAGSRYRARIMVDRREISLGHFDDPLAAARAYDAAARTHFGAFACVNFSEAA